MPAAWPRCGRFPAAGHRFPYRAEGAADPRWRGRNRHRRLRDGADDPAAAERPACAALRGGRDFARQPYIVGICQGPFAAADARKRAGRGGRGRGSARRRRSRSTQSIVSTSIHLDIKPSNIMLCENGEAVLIDYGLSRHEMLPDLLAEEFRIRSAPAPTSRRNRCAACAPIRARTCFRSACCSITSRPAAPFGTPHQSALRTRLWRDPVPPRASGRKFPNGSRRSCCAASKATRAWRHPTAAQLAFDLQNPGEVAITARGRADEAGFDRRPCCAADGVAASRRFAASMPAHFEAAPIVMAAVDLGEDLSTPSDMLRETSRASCARCRRRGSPASTCSRSAASALNYALDEQGRNIHVQRLRRPEGLGAAARPAAGRATFHVLEAPDTAGALLDYAARNRVDHVILGARAPSALRRLLGSVASRVVAEAPCTVTLVATPGARRRKPRASRCADAVSFRAGESSAAPGYIGGSHPETRQS